ncbi:MAG: DUF3791 domain-containing protein [Candidatus Symbiothrix sp.]|jgi:hypothetical protein|nr:DUF3791 domain-containing protein [Candidatus Symbiothrix sp.]
MSKVHHFIIFCLESYKSAMNISGHQALDDFEKQDVFSYLTDGYEVLHTQGRGYLIEAIKDYIAHRQ